MPEFKTSSAPTLGGSIPQGFEPQFTGIGIDVISLSVTPILLLSNDGFDQTISHGTGFFWRDKSDVFLLSARHVFSGLHPFTNEAISKGRFFPRKLKFFPTAELESGSDRWERIEVTFSTDDDRFWIEDPEFEKFRTDIAAIKLAGDVPKLRIQCLNDASIFQEVLTASGFDCSVVGYPTPNFGELMTPVWRRGSIASEPMLAIDNKPLFLLDSTTAPGFSGAPVFRRHIGPRPTIGDGKVPNIDLANVCSTTLVGVYAGRLGHVHFAGEVPFAFYANRIDHIIRNASRD